MIKYKKNITEILSNIKKILFNKQVILPIFLVNTF